MRGPQIVALTAAMPYGTGVGDALERFPDRSFRCRYCEQHCVTFCGRMSCEGLKPVCAIYSTFLQRAFDQLVHDVCIQNLNVKVLSGSRGYCRGDGQLTRPADIAYLRAVPNIIVIGAERRGRDARP